MGTHSHKHCPKQNAHVRVECTRLIRKQSQQIRTRVISTPPAKDGRGVVVKDEASTRVFGRIAFLRRAEARCSKVGVDLNVSGTFAEQLLP